MKTNKIHGFSLLELIVIITIVAIISILAVPKWFNSSMRLNTEIDRLVNNIYLAEELAINTGYNTIISFVNCRTYSIKLLSSPEQIVLENINIDNSITITSPPCDDIEFTRTYGLLTTTSKTISLVAENTGNAKDITINAIGEITITSN
ncbi:MAG: prepilin-type N-terminal cleavage/methylation domain-containing protein [Legionellales bacterium]|nr:prepilin-type N-terminal cleavage/methylation domain-containing protein [Legionellales bacterium]